jgi:hypothetical protein
VATGLLFILTKTRALHFSIRMHIRRAIIECKNGFKRIQTHGVSTKKEFKAIAICVVYMQFFFVFFQQRINKENFFPNLAQISQKMTICSNKY